MIAWVTDIHLNCVADPGRVGEMLAHTGADLAIVTGDISEPASLAFDLDRMTSKFGLPIFFVLGNHDYWDADMEGAHRATDEMLAAQKSRSLVWLRRAGVVELDADLALVGIDGLYDAGWGKPEPGVSLNDFVRIRDLNNLHWQRRIEVVREWGRETAALGESVLRAACANHKRVIFATHVPPFPQLAFAGHDNARGYKVSALVPWYSSRSMGEMLLRVADDFPSTEIRVLCGHTHARADEQVAPNLRVSVGAAEYAKPILADVFRWGAT